jgi:hypothetical protein
MITILEYNFLYHKLQKKFICHVHYTSFTCDKRLLKFLDSKTYFEFFLIQIPQHLNCECFFTMGNRLLSLQFVYYQK